MTWGALFRHEILSRDPSLLAIIPKYLRASMTNLVKVSNGNPKLQSVGEQTEDFDWHD